MTKDEIKLALEAVFIGFKAESRPRHKGLRNENTD